VGLDAVIARRANARAAGDGPGPADLLAAMDRAIARPRLRWQWLGSLAIGIAACGTAIFAYVNYGLARRIGVDIDRLAISTVVSGIFHETIPLSGTIQPDKTVFLDSPLSGQVVEKLVEEGGMVAEGQPLVRLRNTALELRVSEQQQQLAQALYQINAQKMQIDDSRLSRQLALDNIEGQIALHEQKLARLRALGERGFAKRAEIEDLRTQLAQAYRQRETNRLALSEAMKGSKVQGEQIAQALALITKNFAEAGRNLDDLLIRAPIAGQLTDLNAEIGAVKGVGNRLGQIDRTDSYKVVCLVDEFYLGRFGTGEAGKARIGGTDVTLRVTKIHPEVKDRQFAVDLAFDGPAPPALRRGQTVRFSLEIGEARESLIVANGPFYDDSGRQYAFVLSPAQNQAIRRPVTLGRRTSDAVEILSGLTDGDRIVTSSYADFQKIDTIDIRP
jgi:HlyD family secretion protein